PLAGLDAKGRPLHGQRIGHCSCIGLGASLCFEPILSEAVGLTVIRNSNDILRSKALTTTNVLQGSLHRQGDYELVVFEIPAHTSQKPHYHRHGIIDIFMVQDGEGWLHLSKIRNGVPDPASCEVHPLKAGDTYALGVGTLHAIETKEQRIVVMNIAQPTHSAYVNASDDSAIDIVFP
ncbi:hypothetical protein DBR45_35505, partial [Pseudomonas sp. HMWF031]